MAAVRVPETRWIPSENGVEVAVHDYGGDGRPTLFVHGTGMVGRMWEPVMERLPEGLVRPLAIDLRAHGASRTPDVVTFTDHRMVADLTAVCDAYELDTALAVGHSMGGGTAILTSLARPGALARLWTYEPIIFPRDQEHPPGEVDLIQGARNRRSVFPSRQAAFARYSASPGMGEIDPDALWAYLEHGFVDRPDGAVELACSPDHEADAFNGYLQKGFERLGEVSVPVLVAYGGANPMPPGQWSPKVAESIPEGIAECYESSGHFGCFGELDRTARSIAAWFSR